MNPPLPPPDADSSPNAERGLLDIDEVLRFEEVVRTRAFFRAVVVLVAVVAAFVPLLGGDRRLQALALLACALEACVCVAALAIARERRRFSQRVTLAVGLGTACAGVAIVSYVGLFSAGAMALALGIFYFGLSRSRPVRRAFYGVVAVLYFLLSAGVAGGLLPDAGLFRITDVAPLTRWYQVAMSQMVFGVAFFLARTVRRAQEGAFVRVRRTHTELLRRGALLSEARIELDRALGAGEGRYTGQTLGDYRLAEVLGRGGMGEVYRARHEETGQDVAIKLLYPNLLDDPTHVQRFFREAQAEALVRSENVAHVYEVGSAPDGTPFIVMELLEGHDLGWYLRKSDRLPLAHVVEMIVHVARALAAVRDAGIVHRDLKPANLFLTDTLPRTWKVLDFGLSKILRSDSSLTKDAAVGTPAYMAPEQVGGGVVDHLTDLYGLTAITYRALTGSPPFTGEPVTQVLLKVLYAQPAPPSQFTKLPVDVELVLAIGMAKRREDRFDAVEELAVALRRAAAGELDDGYRTMGWTLLKRYPWGSTARPRARVAPPAQGP